MTLTEGMHDGEFIGELAMGPGFHIDAITLLTGENRAAGFVIAETETGTPTATAGTPVSGVGGTVGNGTVSAVTADAGAMAGNWNLICTATGATGKFRVMKPDGSLDGILTIGSAYDGGINLTVSDGSNDWLVDDIIPVTVSYAGDAVAKKWVQWDPTVAAQTKLGLLMRLTDATSADVATTALVRGPAVVNVNDITWKSGMSAANKLRGRAILLAQGIKTA